MFHDYRAWLTAKRKRGCTHSGMFRQANVAERSRLLAGEMMSRALSVKVSSERVQQTENGFMVPRNTATMTDELKTWRAGLLG